MGYAIIDAATGRILRTGSARDEDIALMTGPGEAAITGIEGVTDESHYIGPGGVTAYPPKPGPWAAFDFDAGAWFDPRTQADLDAELAAARAGMTLTFAQLMIGLVLEAWMTEAEGEAWLAGQLPAPVLALIATLPAQQRFIARARASRPSVILRADPLVMALGAAQGKTDAAIDAFFLTYATL